MVMLQKESLFPITLGLYEWNGQTARVPLLQESVITGSLVSIVPVIVVFILLQRFWRTGLASRALKQRPPSPPRFHQTEGPCPMQKSAVFVPHFHWDREWYEPFQVFRHRLVAALDTVVETAEANPDFRFTIDGQMAVIEDYLEMRPENRDRGVRLVASGPLAI